MAQSADGADFGRGSSLRFAHNEAVRAGVRPTAPGPVGTVLAGHMASPLLYQQAHSMAAPGGYHPTQRSVVPQAHQAAPMHHVQPQTGTPAAGGFHPHALAAPVHQGPAGFHPNPVPAPAGGAYSPQAGLSSPPPSQGFTTLPRYVSTAPTGFGMVGPEGAVPNSPLAAILAQVFAQAIPGFGSAQPYNDPHNPDLF